MKVILAETAGFCYGVERAVNLARETAKARGGAMLGSIVHNAGVVREIEDLGMRLITSPDQAKAGETVLIRAHGESRATLDALRERGAEVVSAVCPHVAKILAGTPQFCPFTQYHAGANDLHSCALGKLREISKKTVYKSENQ